MRLDRKITASPTRNFANIASMHVDNKVEDRSSLPRIISNYTSFYTKLRHVYEGLKVVFIHILFTIPNPFRRAGNPYRRTPEGEPLEGTGFSRPWLRVIVPIIIGIIIISLVAISSVRIVDAGNRGVLVQFGSIETDVSLDEGLHFVVPFRDNVVQMEVRTEGS